MAEVIAVVGIIASILGIVDGIDKSKTAWRKYLHTSSSLRAELLPILGKLTAFAGILRGLQLQCELDEADADRLRITAHIDQPLRASEQAIRLISTRLDQVFSMGRMSLTFGKVLNKETTAALRILDQSKAVLDLALAADQRTLAKSIESYVRTVGEHLRDARLESQLYYADLKGELREINARESESLQAKIKAETLAWVSQVNYSSNYHAARRLTQQTDTSGHWFVNGQIFHDWSDGGNPSRLLLTGISGSGKTVLCARAIEYVSCVQTTSTNDPVVLYFFFDFNDAAKESLQSMIRALLHQLLARLEAIPDDVRNFYADHQSPASTMPSIRDWVDLLCSHLRNVQNAFIFIDAMDECVEAEYMALRSTLTKLFMEAGAGTRWFVTCRLNDQTIDDFQAEGFKHIEMKADQVDRDIENFLSTTLENDSKLSSFSNEARQCIVSEIKSKSCGMFRYARCQLDSIAKLRDRRVKKVKDALRILPQDLFESYSRILFEAQTLDDWPIIERILVLVSFSARPVTVTEMAEFVALEDDMTSLRAEDRLDIGDALFTINSLVTVRDGIMALTHKSVQDFFAYGSEPQSIFHLYQNADKFIANRCLQYLRFAQQPLIDISEARNMKEPNTTQLKKLLREYPFLNYAATRWPHHLQERRLQEETAGVMAATLPLKSEPNLWKAWLLLQQADIWENQIRLARLLCESFIRGSLITGWSNSFWHERQTYRIRNDTYPQDSAKLTPITEEAKATTNHDDSPSMPHDDSYFWVQAVDSQLPDPLFLRFEKGDLIFIHTRSSEEWWTGSIGGRTGTVMAHKVEYCMAYPNPQMLGARFHDLAILLLEVAFQRALTASMTKLTLRLSSRADLAHYVLQLRRLTIQAAEKMGQQYGKVISECLSNIYWLDEDPKPDVWDLRDSQDQAMVKLLGPLEAMLTSGFRASRSPVKRTSKQVHQNDFGAYPPRSVPYRPATNVEVLSYDPPRYGSALSFGYDRATSTEARYFNSMTVISQSAAYVASAPPTVDFRPYSTGAVGVSYTTSASAYTISMPSSTSVPSAFRSTSTSPSTAMPAPSTLQGSRLPTLNTVAENTIENAAVETAPSVEQPVKAGVNPEVKIRLQFDDYQNMAQLEPSISSQENCLVWAFPDQLSYIPSLKPGNITPSDDERGAILDAAQEVIVSSNDLQRQLQWACSALIHVGVAKSNRQRANTALSVSGHVPYAETKLCETAIRVVEFLADQGHPEAVFTRAKWSEFGDCGYRIDKQASLEGFKFASSRGYARAWYRMGVYYETSNDILQATLYYNKGVEENDAAALYRMGMMTILGQHGRVQDMRHGIEMLYKASEIADDEAPQALYVLGMIHAHKMPQLNIPGDLVALDWKRSVDYLERAAFFGFHKAQLELASAYELGDLGLEPDMSLALHYYILAARRGDASAECSISKIMLMVHSTIGKPVESLVYAYAKRAALDDLPLAQFALGYYHELGINVDVDLDEALEWYGKAAANGQDDAKARMDRLIAAQEPRDAHVDHVETNSEASWKAADEESGHDVGVDDSVVSEPTVKHTSSNLPSRPGPQLENSSVVLHKDNNADPTEPVSVASGADVARESRFSGYAKLKPVFAHFKKSRKEKVDVAK